MSIAKRKRVYDTQVCIYLTGGANKMLQIYLNVKYHKMFLDYVSDNMLDKSRAGKEILYRHFGTRNDQTILDRICYIIEVKGSGGCKESFSGVVKQIIKGFLDQAKFKAVLSK